jgi:hypothetical protein
MIDPRQYSIVKEDMASSMNLAFHGIGIDGNLFEDWIQSRERQVSGTDCCGVDVSCAKIQEMVALLVEEISGFWLGDGNNMYYCK